MELAYMDISTSHDLYLELGSYHRLDLVARHVGPSKAGYLRSAFLGQWLGGLDSRDVVEIDR
jgi:hypothetical protein